MSCHAAEAGEGELGFRYMVRYTVWEYRGQRSINTGSMGALFDSCLRTTFRLANGDFSLVGPAKKPALCGFFCGCFYAVDLRAFDLRGRGFPLSVTDFSR